MPSFREGRGSGSGFPSGGRRSPAGAAALAVLLPFLSLTAGCASLPTPTLEDLSRPGLTGSGIRLEELQWGRKHYIAHCASCHSLHLPSQFTREGWKKVMVRMQSKAKIDDSRRDSIMTYLSAYAADEPGPKTR